MTAVGQQLMHGNKSNTDSAKVNFVSFLNEIENDINETRKELNFAKNEVKILQTEQATVLEMAESKLMDIDRYLNKEIHYLEELISKADHKQKQENNKFHFQCKQVVDNNNELDDHRMELVKRVIVVEDHLGVVTGPLEKEHLSLSGKHNDIVDGTFNMGTMRSQNNLLPGQQMSEYV